MGGRRGREEREGKRREGGRDRGEGRGGMGKEVEGGVDGSEGGTKRGREKTKVGNREGRGRHFNNSMQVSCFSRCSLTSCRAASTACEYMPMATSR